MAMYSVYTDSTHSIEKSNATEAWLWYGVILQGVIMMWQHDEKRPQKNSNGLRDLVFHKQIWVQKVEFNFYGF